MQKTSLLYSGKAKSVYYTDHPGNLVLEFRDDTSAFDGRKKEALARKGRVNNQFNAYVMACLADAGIETHFVECLSPNESVVLDLSMIPVECVVRNRATGGLVRRLGVTEGQVLTPPVFEFFLKNDDLGDPMINESHILTFGWATKDQIDRMTALTLAANDVLKALFAAGGMDLVDYKLEFGVFAGRVVLGDEFSPDGCRLWDHDTGEKMDKDRFRQSLGNVIESYEEVGRRIGVTFE